MGFDRELLAQKYPESLLIEAIGCNRSLQSSLPPKIKCVVTGVNHLSRQFVCRMMPIVCPGATASTNFSHSKFIITRYLITSDIPAFIREMRAPAARVGFHFCFHGFEAADSPKELRALRFE